MWKYLIREIKYIKCRFKEKHFLWFLALSSPCVSHFHFFTYIFNQLSTRFYPNSLHSHSISRITTLIFCIPHIPFRILTFPPWFPTLLLHFHLDSQHSPHSHPDYPHSHSHSACCLHSNPHFPHIPFIPFPNSPFRLLLIATFCTDTISFIDFRKLNLLNGSWMLVL